MPKALSQKNRAVPRLIADGSSYAEIGYGNPDIMYFDAVPARRHRVASESARTSGPPGHTFLKVTPARWPTTSRGTKQLTGITLFRVRS